MLGIVEYYTEASPSGRSESVEHSSVAIHGLPAAISKFTHVLKKVREISCPGCAILRLDHNFRLVREGPGISNNTYRRNEVNETT
jgi:hypothetical protein